MHNCYVTYIIVCTCVHVRVHVRAHALCARTVRVEWYFCGSVCVVFLWVCVFACVRVSVRARGRAHALCMLCACVFMFAHNIYPHCIIV